MEDSFENDFLDFKGKHLFCFGFGYTASFLSIKLSASGCKISGTTTSSSKRKFIKNNGISSWLFDGNHEIPDPQKKLNDVTHILLSIPPGAKGDLVFESHASDLAKMPNLEWVGYLSTTAIYGNHDGGWINEETPPAPSSRRGSLRLTAEDQWHSLYINEGLPLHIFRLAGIYGPGRSAIDAVRSGNARRINKEGHVFNRVNVEDIVQTLIASMKNPNPGSIYNIADDEPAPSHEVIQFACNLTGIESPPLIEFNQTDMAPIVRSFYKDNKRISNNKIKEELSIKFIYPDYRSGIKACLDIEKETMEILNLSGGDILS